jgi:uncharacterized protein (TIGR02453 family)
MSYFTKEFIAFFKELEQNNSKDWFDENRKRYETVVKKPFKEFTTEIINQIHTIDSSIKIEAKNAITRINRDIRFSKDKTPYNIHVGAIISSAGRKDKSVPGIYVQLNAHSLNIFGGAHTIETKKLQKIRTKISNNLELFNDLINNTIFKNTFGEILGEKHKRIPKEFQEIEKTQPLIANKQLYFSASLSITTILDDDLIEIIINHFKIAKPLNEFLK